MTAGSPGSRGPGWLRRPAEEVQSISKGNRRNKGPEMGRGERQHAGRGGARGQGGQREVGPEAQA